MTKVAILLLVLSSLWILGGLVAIVRVTRSGSRRGSPRPVQSCPGISVLKPLCAESGLEENLSSLFEQHYPDFELIFGVQDPHDPAVGAVSRLRARYPTVPCRLVVCSDPHALNPKVRSLLAMVADARHDLVLVSDANIRAPRTYLSELVDTWSRDARIGLVTNLFTGAAERSVGGALEAVQLCGFCASGTALPTLLGDSLVVGKSMFFSRRVCERLGGLERVASVLAEDFVMGKMFQHAGYRVVLAPTVLTQALGAVTLRGFWRRHLRWATLRWRLRPAAPFLELLVTPLALLPIVYAGLGPPGLLGLLALLIVRDVGGWVLLRGWSGVHLPVLLGLLRDACMLAVWTIAPFRRHVRWHEHRVRLGAGTLLYRQEPAPSGPGGRTTRWAGFGVRQSAAVPRTCAARLVVCTGVACPASCVPNT